MDLSLGFPEFSQELAIATKPSLEAVVSRFRSAHKEPDSPVRAIHHQPAAEGIIRGNPAGRGRASADGAGKIAALRASIPIRRKLSSIPRPAAIP